MKYFVLFLMLTTVGGLLFWKVQGRTRNLAILALCVLLTFFFYLFNKI